MDKLNEVQIVNQLKDTESLLVVCDDGSICQIKKSSIITDNGANIANAIFEKAGWYRICVGAQNNYIASAILNFGTIYGTVQPCSLCLYFAGSGYNGGIVNTIGKIGSVFSKARFLYKASPKESPYFEIYYNYSAINSIRISMSSAVFIKLDTVRYVGDEIPVGYSVKEFDL